MNVWEYKRIAAGRIDADPAPVLNEEGKSGWEVAAVLPYSAPDEQTFFLLKRQAPDAVGAPVRPGE